MFAWLVYRPWRSSRYRWGVLLVLAATGCAMAWTYATTHQIFPDTQFYLGWAFRMMGHDRATSERMVFDYVDRHAVFEHYPYLWDSLTGRLSTRPRVLLPALSIPFIWLFGPGAIVVVPGVAFVAAMYLIYRFASIHAGAPAAVAACVLVVLSPLVLKWSVGGLTDSLALAMHAGLFALLPWRRAATWWTVLGVTVLCALTAMARVISPFTLAAIGGLWVWAMLRASGRRWSWTAVTAGAAVGALAGIWWTGWASRPLTSRNQIGAITGGRYHTFGQAVPWYREEVPARLADEVRNIAADPLLVLLIILSLVACVTAWRTVVPWLVLPAWVGAFGVFLLNPAATEFRYELPVLPALAVAVAVLAGQAARLARQVTGRAPAPPGSAPEPAHKRSRGQPELVGSGTGERRPDGVGPPAPAADGEHQVRGQRVDGPGRRVGTDQG